MLNRIYTIGHSTRTLDELVSLLGEHEVTRLADVRRYPASRRYPYFAGDALALSLPTLGILYEHFEDLGGRRKAEKDSPNGAWVNDQFRGYADYMGTREFQSAIERLLQGAGGRARGAGAEADEDAPASLLLPPSPCAPRPTAVMCAEAVPWRCHRNLLADDLLRRGVEVVHIVGPGSSKPHALSKMARLEEGRVIYPPPQATMFP